MAVMLHNEIEDLQRDVKDLQSVVERLCSILQKHVDFYPVKTELELLKQCVQGKLNG